MTSIANVLHHESIAWLKTSITDAFDYLDDFKRLSSHMNKSSWMMAGSQMTTEIDSKEGRSIGSEIVASVIGNALRLKKVGL